MGDNKTKLNKPKLKWFDEYLSESGRKITIKEHGNSLSGHNVKGFYLTEGWFLKEFFDEIKNNPNTSYVSYINDLVRDVYDGNNIPIDNISVFVKSGSVNPLCEEMVADLSNMFGIPTVYLKNTDGLKHSEIMSLFEKWLDSKDFTKPFNKREYERELVSIDFMSENESFASFDDYYNQRIMCDLGAPLSMWYEKFIKGKLFNPINNKELLLEEKYELFKSFIARYFFRKYIAKDSDYKSENEGIVYNTKDDSYKLSPQFDYEYCFDDVIHANFNSDLSAIYQGLNDDLAFAYEKFPREIRIFINKVKEISEKKLVCNEWAQKFKTQPDSRTTPDDIVRYIEGSLDSFLYRVNNFEQNYFSM